MGKAELMTNVTRAFHKVGFQLKKHSPEILVATGVIGTVASAVLACKATLKVNEITTETKETITKIHEATDRGYTEGGVKYSVEDSKKDLTIAYVQTGLKLAKVYAPAVILGTLSIGCMVTSNNILRKRNVALAAAYTAVDKGFKEYRGRVVERFGKEIDQELRYNIKAREIEETIVDENGKEKTITTTVKEIDPAALALGEYQFLFDELNPEWRKDANYNYMFLRARQQQANDILRTRGYLFLNEILKDIGIEESKMGQVVGWVYDPNNPNCDNYIDFGINDYSNRDVRAFINGDERSVLLEFNVDGYILDKAFI